MSIHAQHIYRLHVNIYSHCKPSLPEHIEYPGPAGNCQPGHMLPAGSVNGLRIIPDYISDDILDI